MAKTMSIPLRRLVQLVKDPRREACSDQELVRRFVACQERGAFEELLGRHGPMVWDVCRGMLPNEADAEDAFQATFLVLARRAKSIDRPALLASWLHGVAVRIARKAQTDFARRRKYERQAPRRTLAEAADQLTWAEVRQVVHEEVDRLPQRLKAPLVLCYLQAMTQDQAAVALGLPRGTLKGRLERGRALLRARLSQRGLGPAALAVLSAWPGISPSASVAASLAQATLQAVAGDAASKVSAGCIAARVAILAEGGGMSMLVTTKIKIAAVTLLALTTLGMGSLPFYQPAAGETASEQGVAGSDQAAQGLDREVGKQVVPGEDQWVKSGDGKLALRLEAKPARAKPGAPIQLVASLRNLSGEAINVIRPFGDAAAAMAAGMDIRGPSGKLKYARPHADTSFGPDAFTQLKPGETTEDVIQNLGAEFEGFHTPGVYTLVFEYAFAGNGDKIAEKAGLINVWRGKIRSKSVTVEIQADAAKAGDIKKPAKPLDLDTVNAGLDPKDPRILALVAYLGENGMSLIHSGFSGYWHIVKPKAPDGVYQVSIRSFPASASEEQMRYGLAHISLAYKLNVSAHLAVSYVSGSGTTKATKEDFAAVEKELDRLFQEYQPGKLKPPTKIKVTKEELSFDPKTCIRGGAFIGFGLGSVTVNVLGRENGKCYFDIYYHREGSTTQYQCQVPAEGPTVVVSKGLVTNFPLPKGKEIVFANKAPLGPVVNLQQSVPKTAYVNYYSDVVKGTGAEAKPGLQVKILLTIYADKLFNRPMPGVAKGQPLQFTVGKGDLGPGLDAAVGGMKVGGKRFLFIRQEVASTINDILGGVHPGTQIIVEIELVAAP